MIPWVTYLFLTFMLTPMASANSVEVVQLDTDDLVQLTQKSPKTEFMIPGQDARSAYEIVLPANEKAKAWQLSPAEWQRYETLMQGDAKYQFSQLDPVWVLGIYATTQVERERYARKFLELSEQRLQRALAFNEAFRKVSVDYFMDQAVVDLDQFYAIFGEERPPQHTAVNLPQQGDTLVFFLNPTSSPSLAAYQRMRELMDNASGVTLEIYFGGDVKTDDIQKWAQHANLSQRAVQDGRITLNYDQGAAAAFEVSRFPAGFIVRGDTAMPVEL